MSRSLQRWPPFLNSRKSRGQIVLFWGEERTGSGKKALCRVHAWTCERWKRMQCEGQVAAEVNASSSYRHLTSARSNMHRKSWCNRLSFRV